MFNWFKKKKKEEKAVSECYARYDKLAKTLSEKLQLGKYDRLWKSIEGLYGFDTKLGTRIIGITKTRIATGAEAIKLEYFVNPPHTLELVFKIWIQPHNEKPVILKAVEGVGQKEIDLAILELEEYIKECF